jgi:AcrR family transcriptional regulator
MARPSNRGKLLDCAEELFASHGVGGVSLRTIQSAAALSVGSLQYHFKTEHELIAAVMERRLEPLMARYSELLEAVAANPDSSPREILSALIQPMIELLVAKPEQGQRYLTLMHRLQSGDYTEPIFTARWPDFAELANGLFRKALPHLPDSLVAFRTDLAWDTMLGTLARAASLPADELDDHVTALIDYLCAALEAPVTTRTNH